MNRAPGAPPRIDAAVLLFGATPAEVMVVDLRPGQVLLDQLGPLVTDPGIPILVVGPNDAFEAMSRSLTLGLQHVPESEIGGKLARRVRRLLKKRRRSRQERR